MYYLTADYIDCCCSALSVLSVLGSLDLPGSRDVIGHVTVRFPIGHILFVVFLELAFIFISNGFRDIHDFKRPLCKGQGRQARN